MDGLAARSQYRSIFHILRWKVCNVSKCATWELWEVGQSTNQPPFFASRLPIIRNVYYGRLGKKGGIFWNNICLTGCKWSSLNVPSTGTPVSHPHLGESLFLISYLFRPMNIHRRFALRFPVQHKRRPASEALSTN